MESGSASSSVTMILVIAFLCITIGYVFGWLVATWRAGKEKDETEELLSKAVSPSPERPFPLLLGVFQDPISRRIQVEWKGQKVEKPLDLSADERGKLLGTLSDVKEWLGAPELSLKVSSVSVESPRSSEPVVPPVAEEPVRPPSILSGVTSALADAMQPPRQEKPKSIVEQIDEIFQKKLEGTPYEGKRIFLMEDPRRGVLVRIEGQVYEGVENVPEGEVKQLLRSAVSEWERSQELQIKRKA